MISLFTSGCQNILGVAITLGCAKGLSVIMSNGLIMDTILHFGEVVMSGVSRIVFPGIAYIVYIFLSFLSHLLQGLLLQPFLLLVLWVSLWGSARNLLSWFALQDLKP